MIFFFLFPYEQLTTLFSQTAQLNILTKVTKIFKMRLVPTAANWAIFKNDILLMKSIKVLLNFPIRIGYQILYYGKFN